MTSANPSRRPAGTPAGGQFAPTKQGRPALDLDEPEMVSETEVEDALRLCLEAAQESRRVAARDGYASSSAVYQRGVTDGLSLYVATFTGKPSLGLIRAHLTATLADTSEHPTGGLPPDVALAKAKATMLAVGRRPADSASRLESARRLVSQARLFGQHQYPNGLSPYDRGNLEGLADGAVRLGRPDLDQASEEAELLRLQLIGEVIKNRADEEELLAIVVGHETSAAVIERAGHQ